MNEKPETSAENRRPAAVVARIAYTAPLLVMVGWSIILAAVYFWQRESGSFNLMKLGRQQARTHFQSMVLVRRWVSEHSGVYVPVGSRNTHPNPYLEHPRRDLTTTDNQRLTMMNPTFVTRQLAELAEEHEAVRFRITSLKPIQNLNAPDAWEKTAMESFGKPSDETFELVENAGAPLFRYMGPLMMEQRCVSCHAGEGTRAGGVKGGVSVSFSAIPLLEAFHGEQKRNAVALFGIWLLGTAIIAFGGWRNLKQVRLLIARENELQTVSETLNCVFNTAPVAIVALDSEARVTLWNRSAEEIFGYGREEVVGRIYPLLPGLDPLELPQLQAAIAGGLHASDVDVKRRRRDGMLVDASLSAAPLYDAASRPVGVVGVLLDRTDRKEMEDRLRRFYAQLQDANEEIVSFAYTVSHDLRAPLVNIQGFSHEVKGAVRELLEELAECRDLLPAEKGKAIERIAQEDIAESLDYILSSVRRMDGQISSILKLSRLGRRELQVEDVDVAEVVRTIVTSLTHQLDARQAQVRVAALPRMRADRLTLEQVFGNLLDNAVKYLDPDRPGDLEIDFEESPDEMIFSVRDNGRGIAAHDLNHVFDIFRRGPVKDVPGEGMGLAFVKALLRRQNGRIWVESELGRGSIFRFSLPLHSAATSGRNAAADADDSR